jgi:ATP-dependent RNA helicase DDX1
VLGGRVYYEAYIRDEGLCRFGWSTQAGSLDVGTDKSSWGFGGTGKKSHARDFVNYGEAFGKGDIVGCLVDLGGEGGGDGSISFSKNGVVLGVAFTLPKLGGALYPAICMKNAECGVNFGAQPFRHPPPAGYVGVEHADNFTTSSALALWARRRRKPRSSSAVISRWIPDLDARSRASFISSKEGETPVSLMRS